MTSPKLKQIQPYLWEIPECGAMRVPGRIFATENLMQELRRGETLRQVANVAELPGILNFSMAMPDIHWGYGFAIGGVAAFDLEEGIISPGGVGYDINCGVRLLRTNLSAREIRPGLDKLLDALYLNIPSGVGSTGRLKLQAGELKQVLTEGAAWAVDHGFGTPDDLEFIEESGRMPGARPDLISHRALQRGHNQLGTLGSGNHFVEIQYVDEVFDADSASRMGIFSDQVTVTIHTGSRGLGHQVCDDSIRDMLKAASKYKIDLPDRQLCCAPIQSFEGRNYLGAMRAAVNFAFANRQIITHWVRESISSALHRSAADIGLATVYEVAHNIAKIETHRVDGQNRKVCVHRKGATRAFAPGHSQLPDKYAKTGQPVLIPGDMGRCSYLLAGTDKAMLETFGTTCHGAGRVMSRIKAKKAAAGRRIIQEMQQHGVQVRAASKATIAEEMPEAYKDVTDVVNCVSMAGISRKIARMRPMAVLKG